VVERTTEAGNYGATSLLCASGSVVWVDDGAGGRVSKLRLNVCRPFSTHCHILASIAEGLWTRLVVFGPRLQDGYGWASVVCRCGSGYPWSVCRSSCAELPTVYQRLTCRLIVWVLTVATCCRCVIASSLLLGTHYCRVCASGVLLGPSRGWVRVQCQVQFGG